jgi:DnaJ family protein B protein 4
MQVVLSLTVRTSHTDRQFFSGLGGMGGPFGGLGGMGGGRRPSGMGGRGGMGNGMYDDDDDDDPMSGFSNMPGGMGGGPRRSSSFRGAPRSSSPGPGARSPASAPTEITRPLKASLEDLYHGATKHLKVGRRLLGGGTEEKVLEVQILPGWKSGTKVSRPALSRS